MGSTMLICGYGTGISHATARRFGRQGFAVALAARSRDKLERGVGELAQEGISARAFPCDLTEPEAVVAMIAAVREACPPVGVLHWNAYESTAGDLTVADVAELRHNFDVAVTGLVVAVQALLPDLRAADRPSVLVTGGTLSHYDERSDALAARWSVMGLAVTGAAQHKLVRVLHAKLKHDGIFVGEVCVGGIVKGTAADRGHGTIEPDDVAERLFQLHAARDSLVVQVP